MTIKKAIQMLDFSIEGNKVLTEGFQDPTKSWNQNLDCVSELVQTMANLTKQETRALELIKKEIQPKCSHPKKMRDRDSEGDWYCMSCNLDL